MTKTDILRRLRTLPGGSFIVFGVQQAWAALFGGLMLFVIILTNYVSLPYLPRYDWLFIFAILIQGCMLAAKLEKPHEVITIVLFHVVGLGMELFKTSSSIGSWSYPGDAFFKLGNVPLFSGFMYAAVGSYIARSWRVMQFSFTHYPNRALTALLAVAIYINFFTHHYMYDFRYALFTATLLLYGRTTIYYVVRTRKHHMPIVVSFILVALFIWLAENIATYTKVWLYPDQEVQWHMVSLNKIGSWLLLMIISGIMVDILHALRARRAKTLS